MTGINPSLISTVILTLTFGTILPCTSGKTIRIIGGHKTFPGEIPSMAALLRKSKRTCGGSILNKYCILTAAHCFSQPDGQPELPDLYAFAVGAYNIKHLEQDGHSKVYNVTKIMIHPNYNSVELFNDVAIACTKNPMQYSKFVKPLTLAKGNHSDYCPNATVYGWGHTLENGKSSDILLKVNVSHIQKEKCTSQYSLIDYVLHESNICYGDENGGRDSCQGDSGGPLLCSIGSNIGKQIGIVSFGEGCARAAFPGVYTSVAYSFSWIEETYKQYTNTV